MKAASQYQGPDVEHPLGVDEQIHPLLEQTDKSLVIRAANRFGVTQRHFAKDQKRRYLPCARAPKFDSVMGIHGWAGCMVVQTRCGLWFYGPDEVKSIFYTPDTTSTFPFSGAEVISPQYFFNHYTFAKRFFGEAPGEQDWYSSPFNESNIRELHLYCRPGAGLPPGPQEVSFMFGASRIIGTVIPGSDVLFHIATPEPFVSNSIAYDHQPSDAECGAYNLIITSDLGHGFSIGDPIIIKVQFLSNAIDFHHDPPDSDGFPPAVQPYPGGQTPYEIHLIVGAV